MNEIDINDISKGLEVNMDNITHRTIVFDIIKMINNGYTTNQIIEENKELWGLSASTIRNHYCTVARRYIKLDMDEVTSSLREDQLSRYLSLYRDAVDNGQTKVANGILANIDKLYGLQTQKVDLNVNEYTVSFE